MTCQNRSHPDRPPSRMPDGARWLQRIGKKKLRSLSIPFAPVRRVDRDASRTDFWKTDHRHE